MAHELTCQFSEFLKLPRNQAFKLFIDTPELWWTSPFQDSGDERVEVGIEPFPGGACYEIDKTGQRYIWGTVLSIEEPLFVRLAWQVSQDGNPIADPGTASRVMVNFRDAGEATRLEIVHSEFLRHGEQGAAYRSEMAKAEGWPRIIESLQNAAKDVVRMKHSVS